MNERSEKPRIILMNVWETQILITSCKTLEVTNIHLGMDSPVLTRRVSLIQLEKLKTTPKTPLGSIHRTKRNEQISDFLEDQPLANDSKVARETLIRSKNSTACWNVGFPLAQPTSSCKENARNAALNATTANVACWRIVLISRKILYGLHSKKTSMDFLRK